MLIRLLALSRKGEDGPESSRDLVRVLIQRVLARLGNSAVCLSGPFSFDVIPSEACQVEGPPRSDVSVFVSFGGCYPRQAP